MSEVTSKATVRTSSFKPGHTVEHLLDSDDLTTFLQYTHIIDCYI